MEEETITVEHTPTPWSLDIDELDREEDGTVIAGMITIRQIERCLHDTEWAESSDWDRDLANAAFIVEAVNNYDSLRARCNALEVERDKLREALGNLAFSYDDRDRGDGCWCSIHDDGQTNFERTGAHEATCQAVREALAEGENSK